jgi:hypothetical protein
MRLDIRPLISVLALLCGAGPVRAQTTNPLPVRATTFMLPSTYSGQTYNAVQFDPRADGQLILWPRTAVEGVGGGTNVAGITNLNGLTNASQTFVTGTSGADFNIAGAGSTHTWNLPTASGSARGALSSADWSAFNGKQGSITWQTNGVTLATAPTTVNWTTGVTGYLSGATANLGIEATGGSSPGPGGAFPMFQFHDTAALAGTTNLVWDQTNSFLKLGPGVEPPTAPITISNQATSSRVGLNTGIRIGSSATAKTMFLDSDALGQVGNAAIKFNINNVTTWFLDIASEGNGFHPSATNNADIGTYLFPVRTNWANVLETVDVVKAPRVQWRGASDATFTRVMLTNAVNGTNVVWLSLFNPSAGQVRKFHSVTWDANGTAHIVETNAADNTSAGGSGWSGYDAPATNATFWSSDTNRTNIVLAQRTGQAVPMLSIRGSNGAPIVEFDNLGFMVMTNSLTNYSLGNTRGAPVGTIVLGHMRSPIPTPTWTDEYKRQWDVGPAIWATEQYYVAPGSGTAVFSHGGTTANTGGTTISHEAPDEKKPYMVKVASAATSNSVGGISHNVNLWNSGAHNGSSRVGGAFFFSRWMITNNLAGIVGGGAPRFFVGLANAASPNLTNIVITTNATGQYMGLMGDIGNSLNLFITCRDATAEFRTNTGINFVATNLYEFSLDEPNTNRFVRWSLRNVTARLEASGLFSNNVPTNFMKMTILTKNGTNRANEIYFSKMYLNPAQSPRWN